MSDPLTTDPKASHTPGPWGIEMHNDTLWIAIPGTFGPKVIAEVDTGFDEPFESQQHANARLIAAAPDLLAALKELADSCDAIPGCPVTTRARMAIHKATGERP